MGSVRRSVPRFRREGELASASLTEDDLIVLRGLARYRFLRTTDIFRLLPDRSADRISRRLALLYRAGYLDRPIAQIDQFRGGGSQPLVYALDAAGARALNELTGAELRVDDWKGKNRRHKRENLDHTLAIARFMVDMELGCRMAENVEFISADEIAKRGSGRQQWAVSLPWHGHRADVLVAPDGMFGLKIERPGLAPMRSFYFLEIDRGSMTIAPSANVRQSEAFPYRSSVLRKLLAYSVSHLTGFHQQHFGIPSARVLMVTTSASRAREMQRTASELVLPHLDVPAGLFLFGTRDDNTGEPLTAPYQAATGEIATLLPARSAA